MSEIILSMRGIVKEYVMRQRPKPLLLRWQIRCQVCLFQS